MKKRKGLLVLVAKYFSSATARLRAEPSARQFLLVLSATAIIYLNISLVIAWFVQGTWQFGAPVLGCLPAVLVAIGCRHYANILKFGRPSGVWKEGCYLVAAFAFLFLIFASLVLAGTSDVRLAWIGERNPWYGISYWLCIGYFSLWLFFIGNQIRVTVHLQKAELIDPTASLEGLRYRYVCLYPGEDIRFGPIVYPDIQPPKIYEG